MPTSWDMTIFVLMTITTTRVITLSLAHAHRRNNIRMYMYMQNVHTLTYTHTIWGAVCIKIHYWQILQIFRKVWGFMKLVDIYVNVSGNLTWITKDIIILEMIKLGIMKVVDIYVLDFLVNCSKGPTRLCHCATCSTKPSLCVYIYQHLRPITLKWTIIAI